MPPLARWAALLALLLLAPVSLVTPAARGAGFALLPGVEAAGMAGAFLAVADDWSAAYWNPAGLVQLERSELGASTQVVLPDLSVTPRPLHGYASFPAYQDRGGSVYPTVSGFARVASDRAAYGVAVFAPFGLGTRWDLYDLPPGYNDGATYPGLDHESAIRVVDIHPAVALQLTDRLAAGAGVAINAATVHLRRVRLAENLLVASDPAASPFVPAPFEYLPVDVDVDGSGIGFGANAGLLWHPTPRLRVGFSVRAYTDLDIAGDATVTVYFPASASEESTFASYYHGQVEAGTATREDSARAVQYWRGAVQTSAYSASAKLPLPLGAGVGAAYQATPRLLLSAGVEWTNWSQLDAILVKLRTADPSATFGSAVDDATPASWQGVPRIAVGARYALGRVRGVGVRAIGGYAYERSPVPDATLTPLFADGSSRHALQVGGTLARRALSLTGVYRFTYAPERTVADYATATDGLPDDPFHRAGSPTNVAGAYRTRTHEVVVGVRYGF